MKNPWSPSIFGVGILGLILSGLTPEGLAQEAKDKLTGISACYSTAKTWTATVTVRSTITSAGQENRSFIKYKLSTRKPDHFLAQRADGMPGPEFLFDGSRILVYAAQVNRFSERIGPTPLASLMTNQTEPAFILFTQALPFVYALLTENPKADLLEGVTAGRIVEENNGRIRLAFEQDTHDWAIVAATGERQAIESIFVDMTKSVRLAQPESDATWKIELQFTDWVFDADLPDSLFTLEVPASTLRIPYTELIPKPQPQTPDPIPSTTP